MTGFAARLGTSVALFGLVLVFLGWNGAAGHDQVSAQIPYLISGGIGGLALVVIGAAIVVTQAARAGRAELLAAISDLKEAVERSAETSAVLRADDNVADDEAVVAGSRSYHRSTCRLVAGRNAALIPAAAAEKRGLEACRICTPGPRATAGEQSARLTHREGIAASEPPSSSTSGE